MDNRSSAMQLSSFLHRFQSRRPQLISTIRELASIESPSDHKSASDRLGTVLAEKFRALGGRVRIHRATDVADHIQIDLPGSRRAKPVLLLGHFDTVYPLGTLRHMPCRIVGPRLHGPGVLDMKCGIVLMLSAIEALQSVQGTRQRQLPRPVTVFLVSDEEIGSRSSRPITEALAKKSDAVLVLEPAGPNGAAKTARKGVGDYTLTIQGVAAHAGLDPSKGHSAILELARQLTTISSFNDLRRGISVNPGVIRGGTRTNVIAAEAVAEIDIRIQRASQAKIIDRKLHRLKPCDKHCRLAIDGGINRLPMERTSGVAALYHKARAIARQIGWQLDEASVGGGSDGNFTAALGIPTLDGLGGYGAGAHATHEHILIDDLPRRATLLSALIESI